MLCIRPYSKGSVISVGRNKYTTPTETAFPEIAHEDHVVIFFDRQGAVHKNLILEGQSVKAALYIDVMDRLFEKNPMC